MATLNITTTPEQDARLQAAFGVELRLGRDATLVEVRTAIVDYIKRVVHKQEKAALIASAGSIQDIDVS